MLKEYLQVTGEIMLCSVQQQGSSFLSALCMKSWVENSSQMLETVHPQGPFAASIWTDLLRRRPGTTTLQAFLGLAFIMWLYYPQSNGAWPEEVASIPKGSRLIWFFVVFQLDNFNLILRTTWLFPNFFSLKDDLLSGRNFAPSVIVSFPPQKFTARLFYSTEILDKRFSLIYIKIWFRNSWQ